MKSFLSIAVFTLGLIFTAPVFADEVGPGKPGNETQSSTQSTLTTTVECGYIESLLGFCDSGSTETEESSQ